MSADDDNRQRRRTTWTLGAIKERSLALEGYFVTKGCGRFYKDVTQAFEMRRKKWLGIFLVGALSFVVAR
jgi:hypothetical protein